LKGDIPTELHRPARKRIGARAASGGAFSRKLIATARPPVPTRGSPPFAGAPSCVCVSGRPTSTQKKPRRRCCRPAGQAFQNPGPGGEGRWGPPARPKRQLPPRRRNGHAPTRAGRLQLPGSPNPFGRHWMRTGGKSALSAFLQGTLALGQRCQQKQAASPKESNLSPAGAPTLRGKGPKAGVKAFAISHRPPGSFDGFQVCRPAPPTAQGFQCWPTKLLLRGPIGRPIQRQPVAARAGQGTPAGPKPEGAGHPGADPEGGFARSIGSRKADSPAPPRSATGPTAACPPACPRRRRTIPGPPPEKSVPQRISGSAGGESWVICWPSATGEGPPQKPPKTPHPGWAGPAPQTTAEFRPRCYWVAAVRRLAEVGFQNRFAPWGPKRPAPNVHAEKSAPNRAFGDRPGRSTCRPTHPRALWPRCKGRAGPGRHDQLQAAL